MAFDPDISSAIASAAQNSGLADSYPGYLEQVAQIESRGDPGAHNPSGASGLFQFVPSTARQYGLSDPYDPTASSDAAARLTLDNASSLQNALGRAPTAGELYLAHQQGAGGAAKLLANPDAPAASIVGRSAVVQNGGTPDMTAGQFAGLWTGRFGGSGPASSGFASRGRPPFSFAGMFGGSDDTPPVVSGSAGGNDEGAALLASAAANSQQATDDAAQAVQQQRATVAATPQLAAPPRTRAASFNPQSFFSMLPRKRTA